MTKHLRLIMLSLLAMICMGGYSQVKSVTCTLTNTGETIAPAGDLTLDFSRNTDGKNQYGYYWNCSKGEVTVTAKLKDSNAEISKIVVNAKCGKTTPVLDVKVGGMAFGKQVALKTTNADYTFEGKASGDIQLLFSKKASTNPGSYFLKTITVYYTSTASSKTPTTTTFGVGVDNNTFKVKDGETFEGWGATCTTEGATGKIEYKSSDDDIAKVNTTTGAITLGAKYGTATITAQFVATGNYANSEARYSIKHLEDFVFYESFDKCNGEGGIDGIDDSWSGTLSGEALSDKESDKTDNPGWTFVNGKERTQCASFGTTDDGGSATSPNIQIDQKAQLKFKAACWNTKAEKSQITISVSNGTLTYNGKNSQSVTIDMVKAVWTDYSMIVSGTKSFTVKFAGSGKNNRFFLDEVMVIKVAPQEITLDENGDNIVEAAENVNVTLKRTLYGDGGWNTLCVPFSLNTAQVKAAFGNDVELRKLAGVNGNTITFEPETKVEAGVPYLIKLSEANAKGTYTFTGVNTIAVTKADAIGTDQLKAAISFVGIYSSQDVAGWATEGEDYVACLGADNMFFKAKAGTKMKGFRAFFLIPENTPASAVKAVIDGTATGIEDLVIDGVKANGRVYNLNGQYVGNSLNGLQPGLYIQNGKKIVVK